MPNLKKHEHRNEQDSDKEIDSENEKWNPTPEVFQEFLVRDELLATRNIGLVLGARSALTLKEIKDSTLHSANVIERVLDSGIAAGGILESKGRYSLASRAH